MHLGQSQQAEELYKNALSLSQTALGPNNIETARILNDLAFLYYSQDKLRDAKTFYQWALASTEGAVGKNDPLLAACLKDYAQVLRSLGSERESIAAEDQAKLILTK
jgi:tetratricopeptide (TPR) repeat protein